MNITGLTNHMRFDDIFANARKADGKIDWIAISCTPGLPPKFIDQYFGMLKPLSIEKTQKLDDWLIEKYADSFNWYSLLKHQDVSEEIIAKNIKKIDRMKLWNLVLKTQKLSLQFMVDNIDRIRNSRNAADALDQNTSIEDAVKEKVKSLIG